MADKKDTPRCTAKNRQGNRCGRRPHPGATVCVMHGGKAPQVQRKAKMRLMELVDPAITTLAKIMVNGETDQVKLAAAREILDRGGAPKQTEASVRVEDARDMLLLKLQEMD